jgi:hypothetical protein
MYLRSLFSRRHCDQTCLTIAREGIENRIQRASQLLTSSYFVARICRVPGNFRVHRQIAPPFRERSNSRSLTLSEVHMGVTNEAVAGTRGVSSGRIASKYIQQFSAFLFWQSVRRVMRIHRIKRISRRASVQVADSENRSSYEIVRRSKKR